MKKVIGVMLILLLLAAAYYFFVSENIFFKTTPKPFDTGLSQTENYQQQDVVMVEQKWISSANGWGEVILILAENGEFELSYDLLEDQQTHYFRGNWQAHPEAVVLKFSGDSPYMADSLYYEQLDDNSYRFEYFRDNLNDKCLEISGLVLKQATAQSKTSDI